MNSVNLPRLNDPELAYMAGFISGDGHLCVRENKGEYSVYFTGNLDDEYDFYTNNILNKILEIFHINPKIKIQNKNNTINLIVYSKRLVIFLNKKCMIPTGAKSGRIEIPRVFSSKKLKLYFIQGFVDADFSICLKKRYRKNPYYPVISGSSKSKKIIEQISDFLTKNGVSHSVCLNQKIIDKRFRKPIFKNSIDVYGRKNLDKWMKLIGFRNSKYIKIVEKIK